MLSVFDIFKVGIGPSSSHTVGPMKAAKAFVDGLQEASMFTHVSHIKTTVYGSLALTGLGHHTDRAVLLGLAGYEPETISIEAIPELLERIENNQKIQIKGTDHHVFFTEDLLVFDETALPLHENGLRFEAFNGKTLVATETYYSVGGGFVVTEKDFSEKLEETQTSPFEFTSAEALLALCKTHNKTISELIFENEKQLSSIEVILRQTNQIWSVMQEAIEEGCKAECRLPGPMQLKRRAPALRQSLLEQGNEADPLYWVDWVNLYALAVSEQNASGGRIVTSPTNGAAGIIPAVMAYYNHFIKPLDSEACQRFLFTAAAIGMLFKMNASISGAEVGCQGEVGVSSAMAAAGLAELMGASPLKVTDAAEIAMEHHLGLTCDPVGGQVQIPCIERNAMSAMKAVNACRMAMNRTTAASVSLDAVIETMYQTGKDMNMKYRETSQGGLALNVPPACK